MKVVVPIKQVVNLDDDFELSEGSLTIDDDFVEYELNEWDAYSLEAAVSLCDGSSEDSEVVVVSVGDERCEAELRTCLAKGADRAVRIWDESLQDADALAVAHVLAPLVRRESPDLVLCGARSSDAVYGATGVALAGLLGLPHVAVVTSIVCDTDLRLSTVERELEGGVLEKLRVGMPLLLTVQTGTNQPRYATFRAIKLAGDKPLAVLTLADLGLDATAVGEAHGARVRCASAAERTGHAEMLTGSPGEIAERIAQLIREKVA